MRGKIAIEAVNTIEAARRYNGALALFEAICARPAPGSAVPRNWNNSRARAPRQASLPRTGPKRF